MRQVSTQCLICLGFTSLVIILDTAKGPSTKPSASPSPCQQQLICLLRNSCKTLSAGFSSPKSTHSGNKSATLSSSFVSAATSELKLVRNRLPIQRSPKATAMCNCDRTSSAVSALISSTKRKNTSLSSHQWVASASGKRHHQRPVHEPRMGRRHQRHRKFIGVVTQTPVQRQIFRIKIGCPAWVGPATGSDKKWIVTCHSVD